MDLDYVKNAVDSVVREVSKAVIGYDLEVRLLFGCLLVGGHVLVEGFPGLAKTSLAKAFARTLGLSFSRVQFTPDLLPSDITGSLIFNPRVGDFEVRLGPIFANIVLADEINRAPPKVQSALLEAMQEGQVTIAGKPHELPKPFMVIATQNPIELEGTYPLPEAQLDRFTIRILMNYPSYDDEVLIVKDTRLGRVDLVNKVVDSQDILDAMKLVDKVRMDESIARYIVSIVRATRSHPKVRLGASPRAAQMLGKLARAWALLDGRDYVIPDDVKQLAPYVLNHRIIVTNDDPLRVINEILEKTPTPMMAKALGMGYSNE
ncbi:MAG: magnesium chelatase [Vulcanisaeta sp. MG_3]|jgi:MoxR-like ATPases|nr:MAG: magnesium chelatase [Vulcanisaeta sp. MG_3]